ncbi:tRNA pseudouridine(38-40) synthase TruA [Caproiciproducens galactitolivorans]|uniref:tRNA pseudouridine synthase A n=1 Tax=Caproiciproducens galactitolivorans TaxID=642589 RepID=A0ABT4BV06_9FIRM|nr:tRNA pseudouridine(38-40) synthase TruA [Caproiciproducens galactitolivorans]MCY1713771.1 tRNA pseudouridine(38-40) synthase TruA [Caproiciproducens galactitolivorans]
MRNLMLTICYDGTGYHGWQIQQNAVSVQQVFQEALVRVLHEKPDIKGCSRTDSFVHAREYCISLKTEHTIPCARLLGALNHFLPEDIAVLYCREVSPEFHARYSCTGKEYVYQIWNNPVRNPFLNHRALHYWYALDLDKLNEAAACYLGAHDFSSFCTLDARERGNMVRTVTKAECGREGDLVTFTVAADGFLYNMVRIMVGTLLRVAQGKLQPRDIPGIIEAKDRKAAGPTAPPCGLYLNHVYYKDVK